MKFVRVPLLFLLSIALAVGVLTHLQVPDVEAQGPSFGATLTSGSGPPSLANGMYASIYSDILNKHTYACQAPTYPQWVQVDSVTQPPFNGGTISNALTIATPTGPKLNVISSNYTDASMTIGAANGIGGDLWKIVASGGSTYDNFYWYDITSDTESFAMHTNHSGGVHNAWTGTISNGCWGWTSDPQYPGNDANPQTCLWQSAANVVTIGNGTTPGDASGTINTTHYQSNGTPGISATIPLAKLTTGGTQGSYTVTNGIITAVTNPN